MAILVPVNRNRGILTGVGIFRVKPFELSPFRVKPLPRPCHALFRRGLNSMNTRLFLIVLRVKPRGLTRTQLTI
jgi:hypothetical protein